MYYNKFMKYKNKVDKLIKTGGNNNINISNILSITYYNNKENNNKKIIVLGDSYKYINTEYNENTQTIESYMTNILDNSNDLNFFIETSIPEKSHLSDEKKINELGFNIKEKPIIELGREKYKKKDNVRIHFTDTRNKLNGFQQFIDFYYVYNLFKYGYILQFSENLNMFQYYLGMTYKYNNALILIKENIFNLKNNIIEEIKEYEDMPIYFVKEINKSLTKDKDKTIKLLEILLKHIDNYLYYINIKYDTWFIDINFFDTIMIYGEIAGAAIANLYTVLRIMKSDYTNKCIIYVGNNHVNIINEYLNILSYDIYKKIFSDENGIVNGVEPFDNFLNNNNQKNNT